MIIAGMIVSCEPERENSSPVARVDAVPQIGDSTTIFKLEGRQSSDDQTPYFSLKYRWDIDADGIWDSELSTQTSYAARFSGTGYKKFMMEVTDDDGASSTTVDSVFLLSQNPNIDTLIDSRDGQRYRIVKIGENWWLADNLRYGIHIQSDVSQTNNNKAEFYYLYNDTVHVSNGGLYTWVEANNYPNPALVNDICPPGWGIPTVDQWTSLFETYPQPFDIVYYFGPSSVENLGIEMSGYYQYGDPKQPMAGEFIGNRSGARYWTSKFTGQDTTRFFTAINLTRDSWSFASSFNRTEWRYHPIFGYIIGYYTPEACYVKCIKK